MITWCNRQWALPTCRSLRSFSHSYQDHELKKKSLVIQRFGNADSEVYYSTLPSSMPSDPNINPWLEMEGILGLAWGGTKWFTSPAAQRLLGGGKILPGGKVRRGMHTSLTGDVYIQPPSRNVYPSRITYNGTEYISAVGAGDFMYTEVSIGRLVNLTSWFIP